MVAFKHLETMCARVTLGLRNDLAVEKYTAGSSLGFIQEMAAELASQEQSALDGFTGRIPETCIG